jgi:hypothetical protein
VWCLADSKSKFVYNFEIYCGKNPNGPEGQAPTRVGEGNMARNVVLGLMEGLEGKGHVLVTDNYFSSIGLFTELANRDIYATGTMRSNRVGLPSEFKNLHMWDRSIQGTLEWKMHASKGVASVMWKDKRPVILISTHAVPVQPPCTHPDLLVKVPRRNGAVRDAIHTSPIHFEYTNCMRGVDVADQLRASYSCQTRSHKWWHRVLFFLIDTTVVNMYIIYLSLLRRQRVPSRPMTHLQFKTQLCHALLQNWPDRNGDNDED